MKIYRYSPAGSLVSWADMPEALAHAALASEPRCTAVEPPTTPPGMAPKWTGQSWVPAQDLRGQIYHDPATKERMLIREVGDTPPAGWISGLPLP